MAFVILIQSNPEISHRACEGVRIALGLAAGGHEINLILVEKATLLLTPDADEQVDGELMVKFLAGLKEFIPVFYVHEVSGAKIEESDYPIQILSPEEIAAKISGSTHFAIF